MSYKGQNTAPTLFLSSREFFDQTVTDAFERRNFRTFPLVKGYLVELLESYIPTQNLFDDRDSSGRHVRETLAETFLKAQNAEPMMRIELLKKLGDRSLYISGFFGDSLQRKLVDVDYYADMGCTAYRSLSESVREDTAAKIYREFSYRFLEFVDVLSEISQKAQLSSEENIMRLFELYAKTGSDLAREKLLERGLIAAPFGNQGHKKSQ